MKKLETALRLFLVILFIYASISKLYIVHTFQEQIAQSPIIPSSLIVFLSYFIPMFEIFIAMLLTSVKYLRVGMLFSFLIMLLFSSYLITLYILFQDQLPCACGGILNNMGYPEHIVFNVTITILTLIYLLKYEK